MAIMIAAKAASSTEGANHDIMSVSEPEACMHGYGERRMAIMNEVHDIMSVSEREQTQFVHRERQWR